MADEMKKNSAEKTESAKNAKKEKKEKAAKADKSAAKGDKSASKGKKPNIFVRMGRAIKKFFKDFRGECKKVVWPDAKTVLKSTGVVLVSVVVIGLVIWLIDTGLSELIKLLVNLAEKVGSENAEETTAAVGAILTNFIGR